MVPRKVGTSLQVKAECHSDDHIIEVTFDAEPWFEQASDEAVVQLASCGWGNDYPADDVASFVAGMNQDVQRVFTYLKLVACKRDHPGFECTVERSCAIEWIRRHG